MAEEQDVNNEEVSQEEVQSEEQVVEDAVEKVEEEVKEDRPKRNYEAELARKDAELQRLKALKESKAEQPKRDPTDLTTWADHELKAVMHSNDPGALALRSQAEDILIDRKLDAKLEHRVVESKNKVADTKLKKDYPDALNPDSALALKMEEVMEEYDLPKSPSGRLAAARIAASETKKGPSTASDTERNRIARVKGQMVDGDRSKSTERPNPKKKEETIKAVNEGKDLNSQAKAFGDILKEKGISRQSFFGK